MKPQSSESTRPCSLAPALQDESDSECRSGVVCDARAETFGMRAVSPGILPLQSIAFACQCQVRNGKDYSYNVVVVVELLSRSGSSIRVLVSSYLVASCRNLNFACERDSTCTSCPVRQALMYCLCCAPPNLSKCLSKLYRRFRVQNMDTGGIMRVVAAVHTEKEFN